MKNQTNPTPPSNPREIAELLSRIMALSETDRTALASSWHAMDPATAPSGARGSATATAGDTIAPSDTEAQPSQEEVAEDVGRWIDSLNALAPEQRLLELEKALEQEEDEAIARQLQQAIATLLSGNKMLAAKVALFRYAYEHPFLAVVGALGLLATVVMIGKGVVLKLF